MTVAPAQRLARVAARLRYGSDDDRFVAAAFERFLTGDDCDLVAALGFKASAGQRSWRTQTAQSKRDGILRQAAEEYFGGLCASEQARELATALSRYAASAWKRERTLASCPDRYCGRLQRHLWAALAAYPHALSERRIRAILATSSGYSWPSNAPMLNEIVEKDQ